MGRINRGKPKVLVLLACFLNFILFYFFNFREIESAGVGKRGRRRENLKQAPPSAWRSMWGPLP